MAKHMSPRFSRTSWCRPGAREPHAGAVSAPTLLASIRFVLLALFIPILAGCAHQEMLIWRASDLEMHAASPIRLVNQGQTVGYVSREKVKLVIDVKGRIEQVVPGVYADLLIVNPKEPNAFASIYNDRPVIGITLGMLELVGWDRDAYAAVIGHEFAHLALHHGVERAQREGVSRAASEILGLVLSQAGVPMGGTLANLAVTAVERTYTRDEERDADKQGFEYLVKAGYDPDGSIRLWQKMQTASSGFSIPFLATHPISQERIEAMRVLASTHALGTEMASPQATMPEQAILPAPQPTVSVTASPSSGGDVPAFLADAQRRLAVGKQVWISMEPLGLYRDASRESERVERIYKKDALVVEEIADEWLKVRLSTGSRGWIMRNWVGSVQ